MKMLQLINILVIICGLTNILGIENDKFINTLNSMEELVKSKFTLLDDLNKQFNDNDLAMVSFRNAVYNDEKLEAFKILHQHISSTATMYLLLKGLSEEWRRVEKLSTSRDLNHMGVKNYTSDEIEKEKIFHQHCDMLCDGQISLPDDIKKQLKCRYVHESTPFLKIAPFKEEEIYLEPRIVMFHDVISDEEIDTLKMIAIPMLAPSEVSSINGSQVTDVRIAETAALFDDDHKHVRTVNRRVEDMTNLNIDTAELLQITYYQVGGKYNVHFDFDLNQTWPFGGSGNRVATVMFYLNEVEKGGNTIFIDLNVTITPKKGSAILWYNIRKNGDLNFLSGHAGCPVTAGTKWIANKWINEIGQEFHRPCTWEKEQRKSSYYEYP